MSKGFEASCQAGVVTMGGLPVPTAAIQSKGVGSSTGVLFLDEDKSYYFAKAVSDVETLIDKLVAVIDQAKAGLDKAVAALTKIDTHAPLVLTGTAAGAGALTGTAAWTPVAASDISSITAATTELSTIKTDLNTFKGNLI